MLNFSSSSGTLIQWIQPLGRFVLFSPASATKSGPYSTALRAQIFLLSLVTHRCCSCFSLYLTIPLLVGTFRINKIAVAVQHFFLCAIRHALR